MLVSLCSETQDCKDSIFSVLGKKIEKSASCWKWKAIGGKGEWEYIEGEFKGGIWSSCFLFGEAHWF